MAATPGESLDLAFRTLAADHLGLTAGQAERRVLLAGAQQDNGSWPACAYYRMGRFLVYFGSPYLTTVFALTALRPRTDLTAAPAPAGLTANEEARP
ncbi:hypothetical protein [Streptomyces sp. NPDC000229]|uniref:hypothetical protein n=1 Tax=Streptomyces sp. NPDC000229 TaxID=3154247 RepID=UPI003317FE3E